MFIFSELKVWICANSFSFIIFWKPHQIWLQVNFSGKTDCFYLSSSQFENKAVYLKGLHFSSVLIFSNMCEARYW